MTASLHRRTQDSSRLLGGRLRGVLDHSCHHGRLQAVRNGYDPAEYDHCRVHIAGCSLHSCSGGGPGLLACGPNGRIGLYRRRRAFSQGWGQYHSITSKHSQRRQPRTQADTCTRTPGIMCKCTILPRANGTSSPPRGRYRPALSSAPSSSMLNPHPHMKYGCLGGPICSPGAPCLTCMSSVRWPQALPQLTLSAYM